MEDKHAVRQTTLYHYCSTSTFLSIIKNRSFWLSDLTKSNDMLELKGYIDMLSDAVKEAASNDDSIPVEMIKEILKKKKWNYYCLGMCFTDKHDAVAQWQAYGDDGNGFAIGITYDDLESISESHPLFRFSEVAYYERGRNEKVIRQMIEKQIHELKGLCGNRPVDYLANTGWMRSIDNWASNSIHSSASFFKHGCFSEERESRLCYLRYIYENQMQNIKPDSMLNKLSFRANRTTIIPYLSIDISKYKNIINTVIIGPCNKTDVGAVYLLLAQNGFEKAKVIRSETYYVGRT